MAHGLGIDRTHVLASMTASLVDDSGARFGDLVRRRCSREPLAYIIGEREFYGLAMVCTPAVLIPRPETELLVEIALNAIGNDARRVLDIGTGSGCVAVAIAVNSTEAAIIAVDLSSGALEVAAQNVARHDVGSRVALRRGDLLADLSTADLIVANLPYVSEVDWARLQPEVRDFEPREALVAGPLGTEAIEALILAAPSHLASGGVLAAEMGASQGAALVAAAKRSFPTADISVRKDLAGHDRVLVVQTNGSAQRGPA